MMTQPTIEDILLRTREAALSDEDRESDEYWEGVRALQSHGGELVVKEVLVWCADPSALLRACGADVLGQLQGEDRESIKASVTPAMNDLLGDPEPVVIACALVALGHLGGGEFAAIAKLATHESSSVRESVAYCLSAREGEEVVPVLIRLSADEDRDTRNWATFGLGSQCELDRPDLREALVARLEDGDFEVRGEAMVGLAQRQDQRARETILNELRMDDVSDLSIEAAALIPHTSFLEHLKQLNERHPGNETIETALESCKEV